MSYQFKFEILKEFAPYMAKGLWYTVIIGFWSIFFSTIIGMFLATIQLSQNKVLKAMALVYIDIFRTMPLVCLLILVHFVVPILSGINFSPLQTAILSLSLNGGAMACEAFRGGLEAIPTTQRQAAYSLGLSPLLTLRHVIIPQAIYSTLPPLTNVYITTIKNVSITMILSVPEIMFRAQELTVMHFRPLEFYICAAVMYIALIVVFSYLMRQLEKLKRWEAI